MKQQVVFDYPPEFEAIDAVFGVRGKPVIFSYGDRIFNPMRLDIPPQLLAHEAVHGRRQMADVAAWWRRYLADPAFRLAEEVPAHYAELEWFLNHGSRKQRRAALKVVAGRLAAPLYGPMVTQPRALKLLAEAMKNAEARLHLEHIAIAAQPPHPTG